MPIEPTSSDAHLPTEALDFPDDFVWGTACAAHQVEGGNWNNDWWAWEHTPASGCVDVSGDATDYWNRYEEDYDLLAAAGGQTVHRFSLEWSRIEPEEGEISQVALDRYKAMCDALIDRGIQPMVTFHHFTTPRWAVRDGGWTDPAIVARFARFVDTASAALGPDRLPWACTINEPGVVANLGYLIGMFPPGHRNLAEQSQATINLIRAHAAAIPGIRAAAPDARIGLCVAMSDIVPSRPDDPGCVGLADQFAWRFQDVYLEALRTGTVTGLDPADDTDVDGLTGTSDFVGCQYYMRTVLDPDVPAFQVPEPAGSERTLMGYASWPPGLGVVLRRQAATGLPVLVTENGVAVADDRRRCAWIAAHLAVAHEAMVSGDVDLRGFIYWSATDNFEWALGYRPTFGLIGIDRANGLARAPRPSLEMFGKIASSGRLDPDDVVRYVEAPGRQ